MNILYDFITVCRQTGAGEYQRRVLFTLLEHEAVRTGEVVIYGLYDSSLGIAYADLQPEVMEQQGVRMIDVRGKGVDEVVRECAIDRFFIACAQYVGKVRGIEQVACEVVCVVHDLANEEQQREHMDAYFVVSQKSKWSAANWLLTKRDKHMRRGVEDMQHIVQLYRNNSRMHIIAVSDYTAHSLMYTFGMDEHRMTVLYSPHRVNVVTDRIEDDTLRQIVSDGKPYMLLLGAQHNSKNARRAVNAYAAFCQRYADAPLLMTVGWKGDRMFDKHVIMPFLSDGDLEHAYAHCHALLYPSLFEGFGYPPVEAMRYGKPVLTTNIGPVREVLQQAPLYFSPFYETDIYSALCTFMKADYDRMAEMSAKRYAEVHDRQESDLKEVIKIIIHS